MSDFPSLQTRLALRIHDLADTMMDIAVGKREKPNPTATIAATEATTWGTHGVTFCAVGLDEDAQARVSEALAEIAATLYPDPPTQLIPQPPTARA